METIRKGQMGMLKGNIISEMKSWFDGLITRLDTAEGRHTNVEEGTTEIIQTERRREKKEWVINIVEH